MSDNAEGSCRRKNHQPTCTCLRVGSQPGLAVAHLPTCQIRRRSSLETSK
jgi:hypothetical protein